MRLKYVEFLQKSTIFKNIMSALCFCQRLAENILNIESRIIHHFTYGGDICRGDGEDIL